MSNGSEHMLEQPLMGVFSYSTLDGKMYKYDRFTEPELQNIVEQFPTEIFFVLTGEEVEEVEERNPDNLKNDFIYYHPTINGTSWWECTCGNFLETDTRSEGQMLRRVVAHARKSGHTINPRGN
jgi:hypothetical protein